jgi:hypothetical protein
MTKRNASELTWIEVSVESKALADRLNAVREAEKAYLDLKRAFEVQFIAAARKKEMLDEGFTLAFGYRFGKLSVAKVPEKSDAPKAASKPTVKF